MTVSKHLNFSYKFETTRKGYGSTIRFETRVVYRAANTPDHEWVELPGVFFKSRLNKKEVGEVLGRITLAVLPVGQRVQTCNGPATILGVQENGLFTAKLDYFSQQTLGLSPFLIEEVL